jgi:hypothetical protein
MLAIFFHDSSAKLLRDHGNEVFQRISEAAEIKLRSSMKLLTAFVQPTTVLVLPQNIFIELDMALQQ